MHWITPFGKLMIVGLFAALFSCKSVVKKYDARLVKKMVKNGFISNRLKSNGHEIFYYDNLKEGLPVLIFIHGFGGDGKLNWQYQVEEFKDDYRVIMPDLLWFGNSTSSHKPSLITQINALKTLMNELHLEKVHLSGISYGGFVVLGYTLKYESTVASLTIIDSPGDTVSDEEIDAFCKKIGVKNTKEAFVLKDGEGVKRLMNFSFYRPPKFPGFILDQVHEQYFSKHHEEQRQLLDDLPKQRLEINGYSQLKVPSLVLWGEEDIIFSTKNAKDLADSLNAELKIFPKAGHALPGEKKKEVNETIREFLSKKE